MKPYLQALKLLKDAKYAQTQPILTAVEGKLPASHRRDARFYIAFCYAQLEEKQIAESSLAALHREDARDVNAAYLLAYPAASPTRPFRARLG